jgi:uncharacterized protein (TIGR02117 family)
MSRIFVLLCVSLALLAGCTVPKRPPSPRALARAKARAKTEQIWLVSNGFHTSIALRAKDAPSELRAFNDGAHFFVIGWGGRDVYMGRKLWPWQYVTSVFLPTPSALHVIPIRTSLVKECPNSEIIEFDVSPAGLAKVRKRISAAFRRDPFGQPDVEGPGKVPHSRFFSGSEIYFFPKTCNLWAAASLHTAGVRLRVSSAIVADNLLWQGRKLGRVLAYKRLPEDPL